MTLNITSKILNDRCKYLAYNTLNEYDFSDIYGYIKVKYDLILKYYVNEFNQLDTNSDSIYERKFYSRELDRYIYVNTNTEQHFDILCVFNYDGIYVNSTYFEYNEAKKRQISLDMNMIKQYDSFSSIMLINSNKIDMLSGFELLKDMNYCILKTIDSFQIIELTETDLNYSFTYTHIDAYSKSLDLVDPSIFRKKID